MGLTCTRNDMYENRGTVYYSTSFNISWPENSYNRKTTFVGNICGITVYTISGSVTIANLERGSSYSYTNNYITCNYSYNYKYIAEETKYGVDENGNSTSWTEKVEKEGTGTGSVKNDLENITIYTHPGPFSMGAVQYNPDKNQTGDNTIISKILAKENIDKWIAHYNKVYHWWNQSNSNYPIDLSVVSNSPITAIWFNKCIDAMNVFGRNYSYVSGG